MYWLEPLKSAALSPLGIVAERRGAAVVRAGVVVAGEIGLAAGDLFIAQ